MAIALLPMARRETVAKCAPRLGNRLSYKNICFNLQAEICRLGTQNSAGVINPPDGFKEQDNQIGKKELLSSSLVVQFNLRDVIPIRTPYREQFPWTLAPLLVLTIERRNCSRHCRKNIMANAPTELGPLHRLCRLYGIQTAYWNVYGEWCECKPEWLLSTLQALGAPVSTFEEIPQALRARRQSLWQQLLGPVLVAWDGKLGKTVIRLPRALSGKPFHVSIELEDGTVLPGLEKDLAGETSPSFNIEGGTYVRRQFEISTPLPWGYHHLDLEVGSARQRSLIISAPTRAYAPDGEQDRKSWGLFLPLYALWSRSSWGAGNLSDLKKLMNWTQRIGGSFVGTLPLHALFLGQQPFDPSPYSPVTRLVWNEFYIDLTKSPELARSRAAAALVNSGDFRREKAALRADGLIDYRRHMDFRRRVLKELADLFFAEKSARYADFLKYLECHPALGDYAAFRATTETRQEPWSKWPETLRNGTLRTGDYSEPLKNYHLYAQWLADEQIRPLGKKSGKGALYLDFPLGVHYEGYDVWRQRDVFALAASGGAPPDDFFTKGQNWGFPPLHPEKVRNHGYQYYIECLRHQLAYASQLRIDHIMGLHRLYWVPHGLEPAEGVYVRYPAAEFYAILSLESHRHQTVIVGENLGTVPDSVQQEMKVHEIYGMNVGQFCARANANAALEPISRLNVASLNTHDTATFAGYWHGRDIEERCNL